MKKSKNSISTFIKRNSMYLVLALCILAIGVASTFMLINRLNTNKSQLNNDSSVTQPDQDGNQDGSGNGNGNGDGGSGEENDQTSNPTDPSDPDSPVIDPDGENGAPVISTISFIMPVLNADYILDYSETMVFNSTLNRYSAHKAIDFFAPEGTEVLAVYDGEIKSIENSILTGITVTIDHGDGLITVYNSLDNTDALSVGMKVKQGDVIGEVSTTNRQEYKSGAHLHFEVIEDGQIIDPSKYITFEEK